MKIELQVKNTAKYFIASNVVIFKKGRKSFVLLGATSCGGALDRKCKSRAVCCGTETCNLLLEVICHYIGSLRFSEHGRQVVSGRLEFVIFI